MFVAVSSAFQFAGIIHWISLVILSVFFSEVGKDLGPVTSLGQLLLWGDQALSLNIYQCPALCWLSRLQRGGNKSGGRALGEEVALEELRIPPGRPGPQHMIAAWNPRG